jgi:hypothetical protein
LDQTHLRHGEKRSREKETEENFFVARVHADQVHILKNLKGTMHDIIACMIFLFFELLIVLGICIFLSEVVFLEKRFWKLAFLDKTECKQT